MSAIPHLTTRCWVPLTLSHQVPEVIEDSGDALHLLWAATSPHLRDGTAGLAEPTIARSVVQLMHAFLEHGGPNAGEALVSSGAVAPAVHVRMIYCLLRWWQACAAYRLVSAVEQSGSFLAWTGVLACCCLDKGVKS